MNRGIEKHVPRGAERRVNFIVGGTQKGGTSALHAYLKEHPEICMAERKEVHYYDNETIFSNGSPDYSEYHSAFAPKEQHRLL